MIELTEEQIAWVDGGVAPIAGLIAVGVFVWYQWGGGKEYFEQNQDG